MINVNNLRYTYPTGKTEAVKGLNFDIREGEIFGFLGPSGAGKSTTQKILIGLLRGYQGHINVMGRELSQWGQNLYERIGVSFELPNHYQKLTALENLNYFKSLFTVPTADPMKILEKLDLADDADKRVSDFSKGMKNRLNVARSLLNQPDVLFLDEPTSGLDPVTRRLVFDIIREQKARGKTVFITTHDMSAADQLCDRVAFIVNGEIKLIDAPKSLKIAHGRRAVEVEYQNGTGGLHAQEFSLEGLADNNDFLGLLRNQRVETIHTTETTLENIFIEVTGHQLA